MSTNDYFVVNDLFMQNAKTYQSQPVLAARYKPGMESGWMVHIYCVPYDIYEAIKFFDTKDEAMVVCPKIIKIGGIYMKPLQQKNIIFKPGRVFIDKGTPYQVSLPFTQISYCEPDALYKLGSLFFQFIENGCQLVSTKLAVERMNVRKSVDAGNLMVDLQMLDSGKNVEVKFV